jgi:hypothetical protein
MLWRLEAGMLFVISSIDISRSFLSIYITANLEKLNSTATLKAPKLKDTAPRKAPAAKKAKLLVDNPVAADLMEKIQLELARIIGPIAKVVLSKESKRMGYKKDNFPEDKLSPLIREISHHLEESKQEGFNNRVQDLIFDYRSNK